MFFPKKIGFWFIILQNGTNTIQNFWQKGSYSSFWILASRGQKNLK